jgi:hypothetical protein
MMPPWNLNASVVVPWASLMGQLGFAWSSVAALSHAEGYKDIGKLPESFKMASRVEKYTYLCYRRHGEL